MAYHRPPSRRESSRLAGLTDWQPNVIVVSGDVELKAHEDEYGRAITWLGELTAALGLGADDIVCCPGKHDIDG